MTWYHRLLDNNGLLATLGDSSSLTGVIVQLQFRGKRFFNYFPQVELLQHYLGKLPQEQRCMYELILGEQRQKPHFDLDISREKRPNGDEVLEELLEQIVVISHSLGITIDPLKDILVFTSHGADKWSYHVVIDNCHHDDNLQARQFFELVTKQMSNSEFVDSAVYCSKQNFRLLGCQKEGSTRIKTWCRRFRIAGKMFELPQCANIFRRSLLSQIGENSRPMLITVIPRHIITQQYVSDSETREIEELICRHCPESQIREIKNNLFELTRTQASYCPVCKREHQSENPYVIYQVETGALLKFCRRSHVPLLLAYMLRKIDIQNIPEDKTKNRYPSQKIKTRAEKMDAFSGAYKQTIKRI